VTDGCAVRIFVLRGDSWGGDDGRKYLLKSKFSWWILKPRRLKMRLSAGER